MVTHREELVCGILQIIATERLHPGDRLGSERALSDQLDAPRSAVRVALEHLERSGRIRRTMGRTGGVFVSDGKIERHLNTIQGVPDMLRQQGFHPSTSVLKLQIGLPERDEMRVLGLSEGEHVVRLSRRRNADGVPLSLDTMTLPARRVPGIQKHDLSGGVYELLHREYAIQLHRADEAITVCAASPEDAKELGIAEGDPLFELGRVTYDTHDLPVEYAHDLFRADRTRITMHRYGSRWKRATSP